MQVGSVTFTPATTYSGTLTYNVSAVNVTKQIPRLTLTTIPIGGNYYGGIYQEIYNCTNTSQNVVNRYYSEFIVAQTTPDSTGQLSIEFAVPNGVCTIAGRTSRTACCSASPTPRTCARPASTRPPTSPASRPRSRASRASGSAQLSNGCVDTGYFSAVLN